jgi:hypothetical protein
MWVMYRLALTAHRKPWGDASRHRSNAPSPGSR